MNHDIRYLIRTFLITLSRTCAYLTLNYMDIGHETYICLKSKLNMELMGKLIVEIGVYCKRKNLELVRPN